MSNGDKSNNLTRTFVAIDFPDEVVKEISRVQGLIGKWNFTGKFTELENLHLTLKFLGEIGEEKVERVKNALKEIKFSGFEVRLGDIGVFHFRKEPKIVWIKVLGKGIYELQKKVDEVLEREGFAKEERFMGHLTIARVKYVRDKKCFEEHVKNIKTREIKFKVEKFFLKKSELEPSGPIYKNIEEYSLI